MTPRNIRLRYKDISRIDVTAFFSLIAFMLFAYFAIMFAFNIHSHYFTEEGWILLTVLLITGWITITWAPDNIWQKYLLRNGEEVKGRLLRMEDDSRWTISLTAEYHYAGMRHKNNTRMYPKHNAYRSLKDGDQVTLYVSPHNVNDFIVYEAANYEVVNA